MQRQLWSLRVAGSERLLYGTLSEVIYCFARLDVAGTVVERWPRRTGPLLGIRVVNRQRPRGTFESEESRL